MLFPVLLLERVSENVLACFCDIAYSCFLIIIITDWYYYHYLLVADTTNPNCKLIIEKNLTLTREI